MTEVINTFYPKNNAAWKNWPEKNHQKEQSIWVIYYKVKSNMPTVKYTDAVDIALCYGWIDSKQIC